VRKAKTKKQLKITRRIEKKVETIVVIVVLHMKMLENISVFL